MAKLLGAIGILQTRYHTVKEWAYAGFAFQCIDAAVSWSFVGAELFFVIFPLIVLAIIVRVVFFWKNAGR